MNPESKQRRFVLPHAFAIGTVALLLFGAGARADTIAKSGTFNGLTVDYKVDLPDGYDAARAYPTILAFTGGGQTMDIVDQTLGDWRSVAKTRGYIVVAPAAPDGQLFFEGGDKIFPAFLDQILHDYKVKGGKMYVVGHSNGGLSAFHIASRYPKYFVSVTGYPGLLYDNDISEIQNLQGLCIFMHAGDHDPDWANEMQKQADEFRQLGFKVEFQIEKDQVHRLNVHEEDLQNRLFAQLEEAPQACK